MEFSPTVRVDGPTGDIVAFEKLTSETFAKRHPDVMRQVISTVHTALSQLQELRPGHYVLQHDVSVHLRKVEREKNDAGSGWSFPMENSRPETSCYLLVRQSTVIIPFLPYHLSQYPSIFCCFSSLHWVDKSKSVEFLKIDLKILGLHSLHMI